MLALCELDGVGVGGQNLPWAPSTLVLRVEHFYGILAFRISAIIRVRSCGGQQF